MEKTVYERNGGKREREWQREADPASQTDKNRPTDDKADRQRVYHAATDTKLHAATWIQPVHYQLPLCFDRCPLPLKKTTTKNLLRHPCDFSPPLVPPVCCSVSLVQTHSLRLLASSVETTVS